MYPSGAANLPGCGRHQGRAGVLGHTGLVQALVLGMLLSVSVSQFICKMRVTITPTTEAGKQSKRDRVSERSLEVTGCGQMLGLHSQLKSTSLCLRTLIGKMVIFWVTPMMLWEFERQYSRYTSRVPGHLILPHLLSCRPMWV